MDFYSIITTDEEHDFYKVKHNKNGIKRKVQENLGYICGLCTFEIIIGQIERELTCNHHLHEKCFRIAKDISNEKCPTCYRFN